MIRPAESHEVYAALEEIFRKSVSEVRRNRLACSSTFTIEELEPLADVVVECAPAALLPSIAAPFLQKGKTAIVLSAGALLANEDLIGLAKRHGGRAWAESEGPGRGSTFAIELPVAK